MTTIPTPRMDTAVKKIWDRNPAGFYKREDVSEILNVGCQLEREMAVAENALKNAAQANFQPRLLAKAGLDALAQMRKEQT